MIGIKAGAYPSESTLLFQKTLYQELVLFFISLSNSLFNVIWSFYSGKWRCVSDCTTEWKHEIKLSTNISPILFRTPNRDIHSSLFGPIHKLRREKFYDTVLRFLWWQRGTNITTILAPTPRTTDQKPWPTPKLWSIFYGACLTLKCRVRKLMKPQGALWFRDLKIIFVVKMWKFLIGAATSVRNTFCSTRHLLE